MTKMIVCKAMPDNPRNTEASIVELKDGRLLLAYTHFVGGAADHSAAFIGAKSSDDGGAGWSETFQLQPNIGKCNVMSPSLLRTNDGRIALAFLQKDSPADDCKPLVRFTGDEGETWCEPARISALTGYLGGLNDSLLQLTTGRLVYPATITALPATPSEKSYAMVSLSDDGGSTWRTPDVRLSAPKRGAMEPGVFERKDGSLLMYMRTQTGRIWHAVSLDQGETWSEAGPWNVVAPESPTRIERIPSTGDLLMIWNHHYEPGADHCGERRPLNAAISKDDGATWGHEKTLEDDPANTYSYPSITFAAKNVLLTYYMREGNIPLGENLGPGISLVLRSEPISWFYEETDE